MLEVFLFDFAGGFFHLLLDALDFLVAFVDGNGLDLLGEGQLLDTLLHLLQSYLSLFLY